jgi:hypothetical protein
MTVLKRDTINNAETAKKASKTKIKKGHREYVLLEGTQPTSQIVSRVRPDHCRTQVIALHRT